MHRMRIMMSRVTVLLAGLLLVACSSARGMSGTDRIAEPGEPIRAYPNWADGVREFVNDPLRTIGWHSWFSGVPNDVKRFSFKITKPADVQYLIDAFAKIKSDKLSVALASGNGPIDPFKIDGARLPGVEFVIGDQKTIDAWLSSVFRDKRGRSDGEIRMAKKRYVATPPTLVIYLDNELITLGSLKIPLHIPLSARSRWHWNKHTEKWEPPAQNIVDFVKDHNDKQKQTKETR
jgi:hypothetical protein